MTAERSNVLAFGPLPIGWLHVPLTQERAAAIVQFQERTGTELIPHLLDALDDIVFDLGPARQPGGNPAHRAGARPGEGANEFVSRGASCTEHTRSEPDRPAKSNARSCRDARLCSSPFGRACKGLWPYKTAEELATRAKCGVRAAAYELSGDREPSGRSIAAVVAAISEWPLR
jgi:hypothetical protein